MEITGKIFKVMPEQSGESQRGRWVKQDFVIEFEDGQYARKACFTLFGEEKVAGIKQLALGDKVVVNFNIESREYNDRWYTNLNCWKLDKQITQNVTRPSSNANAGNAYDASSVASMPSANENAAPDENFGNSFQPDDDLPF